ncbi:MAG: DinB family protein [Gemmatimonadaceae bacterium]
MNFALAESVEVLRRTPDVVRTMLAGLSDPWLRGTEGPDTFSPFDVLGHLIDGEETDWMVRARIILEHGESRPFDRYDRFRHWKRNKDRSLDSLLDEFEKLRARNLAELAALKLTTEQLELTGTHPILGVVTMRQLLASWVAHDLGHIAQIARVMAKQYRDDTGPWVQFLPVLTDHETPRS